MSQSRRARLLSIIGPGILVAATGVGAGDLATGAIAGSKLGVAVLWAVALGAGLKFVLNEGLARWQLATGDTLLEGCVAHFGRPVRYVFLVYLLLWSFFVGSALMSACGVTAHAIFPGLLPEPILLWENGPVLLSGKIVFGLLHSVVAVVLVRRGGYRLFGHVMGVCIAIMFVTVVATAVVVRPSWTAAAAGLLVPTIPDSEGEGLQWTVALMGGVGGTLTVLCYGYWIREEGRTGTEDLRTCRIDLATAYAMTAVFGVGMVIIGSGIEGVEGRGANLIVLVADQLETKLGGLGPAAKWAFLLGGWGAVFSSLLGVWQSVPYLFADFWNLTHRPHGTRLTKPVDTNSLPYRAYLYAIAVIPAIGLWGKFVQIQKFYAIIGAAFIPMLAAALLVLNGRGKWVGAKSRNKWWTSLLLVATLVFFLLAGWYEIRSKLFG